MKLDLDRVLADEDQATQGPWVFLDSGDFPDDLRTTEDRPRGVWLPDYGQYVHVCFHLGDYGECVCMMRDGVLMVVQCILD